MAADQCAPDLERRATAESDAETSDDAPDVPLSTIDRRRAVGRDRERYRRENERLRKRVAALERRLEADEALRRAIVAQYELILDEHRADGSTGDASADGLFDHLRRVVDRRH